MSNVSAMSSPPEAPVKSKYRTIDVRQVIAGLPGSISRDVVSHAAFGTLDPRLWEILTDDLWIEAFADAARIMVTDLHNQIEEASFAERDGLQVHDSDWWRRVIKVKNRSATLRLHLERRAKDYRRRTGGNRAAHLLRAIILHKQTVLSEYEPTPADLELWKVLS